MPLQRAVSICGESLGTPTSVTAPRPALLQCRHGWPGQLNNIFESIYQEITKTAEYADVTIHDRLSSWVVSSDSASENGEPAGFTYTKTQHGQTTTWADCPGGDGCG